MRSRTKMLTAAFLAAGIAAATMLTANAASMADGQWCTGTGADATRYWFTLEPDGSRCVANTWMWIKDTDGVVRCYYFDAEGWVVTNTTIDGNQVDADGRWVVNGVVQTDTTGTKDYYTHNASFISSAQQQAPAGNTQAPAGSTTGNNGAVKSSGKGDDPSLAEAAPLGYTISTVNGKTVSNAWANFTMTFPATSGTVTVGGVDEGFDIQNLTNDAQLTIRYVPVTQYGGSTIDSFVAGFIKDGRDGLMGAAISSDVTFGDFTFKQVRVKMPNPTQEMYDRAYMRLMDGTGYVQVIIIRQNGSSEDFSSALSTMKKMA